MFDSNRPAALLSLLPLAALLLGALPAAAQDSIPLPEVRTCAEFEPCLGTVIGYPTGLPLSTLAVELAQDDTLFVFAGDPAKRARAQAELAGYGVNMSNVEFVDAPTDMFYTRDFGAPQTFVAAGRQRMMDPVFYDYAFQSGYGGPVLTLPPGDFRHDDATPKALARHIGIDWTHVPLHLVGGNIDFDGLGGMFCTSVLVSENRLYGIEEPEFRAQLDLYLGVEDLNVVPNFEGFGIQHVDCGLKVVGEETLIIARTPEDHPTYALHEQLAAKAATYTTAYGRPYEIYRVDVPTFDSVFGPDELTNYANSLIVNSKVYVPLFDLPRADAAALEVYREAMPGYEVLGYPFVSGPYPMGSWASFDALHCRTHQVYDPAMLLIKFPRVREAASGVDVTVRALLKAYSGAGLVGAGCGVHWRVAGSASWQFAPFGQGSWPDEYVAAIPSQPAGTTVEYYLRAEAADGRVATRPPLAPAGFHAYVVQ